MQLKSIAQEWDVIVKEVLDGVDIHGLQYTEMQQAFYAGYSALLAAAQNISQLPDYDIVTFFEARENESSAFFDDLAKRFNERN